MFKEFWSLFKHKKQKQKQKGEVNIVFLVLIVIAIVLCTQFYGAIQGAISGNSGNLTIPNAVSLLLGNGYAVSAQGGTFNGNVNATTLTATTLNAPTGRTADCVIAPYNYTGVDQYDYKLTGTNDQTQLTTILAGLSAGSSIYFDEGNVKLGGEWNVTKQVNIECNGTVFQPIGSVTGNVIALSADYITFDGAVIDPSLATSVNSLLFVSADHIKISNGTTDNGPGYGIYTMNLNDFTVEDWESCGNGQTGLVISADHATCDGIHIIGGKYTGNGFDMTYPANNDRMGIQCESAGSGAMISNVSVDHADCRGNKNTGIWSSGITGFNFSFCDLRDNVCGQGVWFGAATHGTVCFNKIGNDATMADSHYRFNVGISDNGLTDGCKDITFIGNINSDAIDIFMQVRGDADYINFIGNTYDSSCADLIGWTSSGTHYTILESDSRLANRMNNKLNAGEIRTASGVLAGGNANSFTFAWQNPESIGIIVKSITIEIFDLTGVQANAIIDIGSAVNGTTHSNNLIAGGDLTTMGFLVSSNLVDLDANGGTTAYITGQILNANATAIGAKYYITYCGR